MPEKHLHVISFDIPYPPRYGGVIDVFYKIKALKNESVKIHLHCFEYGRGEKGKLEQYCETVNYYERNTSIIKHFSLKPYIVNSRISGELVQNLLKDNHPVLFEGLHTCGILDDTRLKNRFKIFRESNIEHQYYCQLCKSEKNIFKKIFFLIEAMKLKSFESVVRKADLFLVVSKEDEKYFKEKYSANKVVYLPSFHQNNEVNSLTGFGDYVLYHGNLSVPENTSGAEYIINIFKELNIKLVIAGLNPPDFLKDKIADFKNIELFANPSDEEMNKLIKNAQINFLITFQGTGLKLKLLNVLFSGRHCLVNPEMLAGTGLDNLCEIRNSGKEFMSAIKELMKKEFTKEEIEKRKQILGKNFSNSENVKLLIDFIPC
ncbi:MAG: glycosyltransferase [Bacteroidales bacterium]|nr:glycosyltransferase [Bacteroidales bacterium]